MVKYNASISLRSLYLKWNKQLRKLFRLWHKADIRSLFVRWLTLVVFQLFDIAWMIVAAFGFPPVNLGNSSSPILELCAESNSIDLLLVARKVLFVDQHPLIYRQSGIEKYSWNFREREEKIKLNRKILHLRFVCRFFVRFSYVQMCDKMKRHRSEWIFHPVALYPHLRHQVIYWNSNHIENKSVELNGAYHRLAHENIPVDSKFVIGNIESMI